ncbi:MAG: hypothetical protein ACLRNQ_02725 [Flavonifractor plautii]
MSGREIPHPTPFAQQMIDEWWRGRFLLYDIGTSTYHDAANILRVFRYAHRRYGAKVYLVDNLMTARFRGTTGTSTGRNRSLLRSWPPLPMITTSTYIWSPTRAKPTASQIRMRWPASGT